MSALEPTNESMGRRSLESFLKNLSTKVDKVRDDWNSLIQQNLSKIEFSEQLPTILLGVNNIKELSEQRILSSLAPLSDELEIDLLNLMNPDEDEGTLLYKAVSSRLADIKKEVENLILENITEIYSNNALSVSDDIILGGLGAVTNRIVFVLSEDSNFLKDCGTQIAHYGYTLDVLSSFNTFKEKISQEIPIAIIADLDFIESDKKRKSGKELSDYVDLVPDIPLLVISSNGDFSSRLYSAKSKAAMFAIKPVKTTSLLDKLDSIVFAHAEDPYRVLVIDDSKTVGGYLSKILQKVGMVVHVTNSPESGLDAIEGFNPDLILMDMYMPVCDGDDLSRIIRQYEAFASIPIVFLSSETDVQKQLSAMKIGADDFLTKQINPDHLITSISTRIQRHRILGSFMIKDSLTGLLNHTTSKKQLNFILKKAEKTNTNVCFAMVDIDFFKKVNDTYGHPTGDIVIKSLARLLQKRLRKTDSIGRYGGEEFAVILWDISAENAEKLLNEIREDFSKILHNSDGKEFNTTFSCGIACNSTFNDAQKISNAADKALYISKRAGRNQVSVATFENTQDEQS